MNYEKRRKKKTNIFRYICNKNKADYIFSGIFICNEYRKAINNAIEQKF